MSVHTEPQGLAIFDTGPHLADLVILDCCDEGSFLLHPSVLGKALSKSLVQIVGFELELHISTVSLHSLVVLFNARSAGSVRKNRVPLSAIRGISDSGSLLPFPIANRGYKGFASHIYNGHTSTSFWVEPNLLFLCCSSDGFLQ